MLLCPRCHSTNVEPIVRRKFSGGKALLGAVIAGPFGLAAGFIGKDSVVAICKDCGYHGKIKFIKS